MIANFTAPSRLPIISRHILKLVKRLDTVKFAIKLALRPEPAAELPPIDIEAKVTATGSAQTQAATRPEDTQLHPPCNVVMFSAMQSLLLLQQSALNKDLGPSTTSNKLCIAMADNFVSNTRIMRAPTAYCLLGTQQALVVDASYAYLSRRSL